MKQQESGGARRRAPAAAPPLGGDHSPVKVVEPVSPSVVYGQPEPQATPAASGPSWRLCVLLLLVVRVAGAFLMPILDCDETFNYWEPTHLLVFGRGLQTWEYSPVYGLRSYLYPLLHAASLAGLQQLLGGLGLSWGKPGLFFAQRLVFLGVGAAAETRFVRAAGDRFGPRLAWLLLALLAPASGMLHASLAFLPQSFTMYLVLLCWAAWLRGHPREAIVWMGGASLLGWPFAAILGLSGLAWDLVLRESFRRRLLACLWTAVLTATGLVGVSLLVDYFFYRRWLLAVLNIALYNSAASGDADRGSAIYGVESWDFYLRNLFLNFNLVLPVALVGPPLLLLGVLALKLHFRLRPVDPDRLLLLRRVAVGEERQGTPSQHQQQQPLELGLRRALQLLPAGRILSSGLLLLPLYLWLGLFSAMPHKEERFMFVVYPLLALAAALPLAVVGLEPRWLPWPRVRRALVLGLVLVAGAISVSRSLALMHNYRAPLQVYRELEHQSRQPGSFVLREIHRVIQEQQRRPQEGWPERTPVPVCVGKEWYRFPSHFFLPELCVGVAASDLGAFPLLPGGELMARVGPCWMLPTRSGNTTTVQLELNFLRSGFRGQLPQPYIITSGGGGGGNQARLPLAITTSLEPPFMNDLNREEPTRYIPDPDRRCSFIVDLDLSASRGSDSGPDADSWSVAFERPFLDAEHSPGLVPRAFWLPPGGPVGWRARWARYQLLVRREAEAAVAMIRTETLAL